DSTGQNLSSNNWCLYSDAAITLRRAASANPLPTPDGYLTYTPVAFNIYRGRGGLFGFVGQTTDRDFVDFGDAPDYTQQPPVGTEPFGTDTEADPSGTGTRLLDRPWTAAFFQERRVFAGSTLKPETVHASATGDYYNFDVRLAVHLNGESLDFTLAARKREEV